MDVGQMLDAVKRIQEIRKLTLRLETTERKMFLAHLDAMEKELRKMIKKERTRLKRWLDAQP